MEIGDKNILTGTAFPVGHADKIAADEPAAPVEVFSGHSVDGSCEEERLRHMAGDAGAPRKKEETLLILAPHAKDREEAEKELTWLEANIKPEADLREMAEFYVIGKVRYPAGYAKKEELLKASLDDIQRYLTQYEGKEREEFKEGLLTLCRVIPQKNEAHVFHCRALDILFGAREILQQKTPESNHSFNFGAMYSFRLPFNPPPPERDFSTGEAAKICAELYGDLVHSKYYYPRNHEADTDFELTYNRNEVYMGFKVMRGYLGSDPGRMAEMRDLFKILGNGWTSLGLMMSLDVDHPGIREDLKKLIFERTPDAIDMAGNELASVAQPYTFLAQNLRPGDDLKGFIDGILAVLPHLGRSLSAHRKTWENKNYVKEMLDQIERMRGDRNSAVQSLDSYKTMVAALSDSQKGNIDSIVDLFSFTGQNEKGLKDAIPGAKNYEDVNREVTDILANHWIKRAFPSTSLTDVLKLGYEQRHPDETLRQSCERLIGDYGLLGEIDGREKLTDMIKKGMKNGDFPGMTADQVMTELDRSIKMKRLLEGSPAKSIQMAYDELSATCRHNEAHKYDDTASVEIDDEFITIGGLRLLRRKE